jgi:hypothetical protein
LIDQIILIALEIAASSDGWMTLQSAQLRSGYSLDYLLEESGWNGSAGKTGTYTWLLMLRSQRLRLEKIGAARRA